MDLEKNNSRIFFVSVSSFGVPPIQSSSAAPPRDYGLRPWVIHRPPPLQFNFQSPEALGSHLNFHSQPSTVRVVISFQFSSSTWHPTLPSRPPVTRPQLPRFAIAISQPSQFLKHKVLDRLHSRLPRKALRSRNFPDPPPSPFPQSTSSHFGRLAQYLGSSPGST